ncbi:MAG: hypothetical protein AAF639_22570 [Chloroflexota bacterium]
MEILAAVIGGLFSLVGIWYANHMQEKRAEKRYQMHHQPTTTYAQDNITVGKIDLPASEAAHAVAIGRNATVHVSPHANASPLPTSPPPVTASPIAFSNENQKTLVGAIARIGYGVVLFFLDIIVLMTVVSSFNLNEREPWWEVWFSILVFGALPVYACYLVISGIYLFFKRAFDKGTRLMNQS